MTATPAGTLAVVDVVLDVVVGAAVVDGAVVVAGMVVAAAVDSGVAPLESPPPQAASSDPTRMGMRV